MTDAEKLANLKLILEDGGDLPSDEKLNVYLAAAKSKRLLNCSPMTAYLYSLHLNGNKFNRLNKNFSDFFGLRRYIRWQRQRKKDRRRLLRWCIL